MRETQNKVVAKGPITSIWIAAKIEHVGIKQDVLRSKEHQGDGALTNLFFHQLQNSLSNQ